VDAVGGDRGGHPVLAHERCPTVRPNTPLLRLTPALIELTRRERDVALLVADGMTSSVTRERLRLPPAPSTTTSAAATRSSA
jgi:hypothetical protein